jgi:hypothetical protein
MGVTGEDGEQIGSRKHLTIRAPLMSREVMSGFSP